MNDRYQKMINHVHGNPDLLKSYIFHKVREAGVSGQKPLSKTFDEMCEVYGNNATEYPEFEFWYIKFYSGNFDMNYDWRSSDYCHPSALQRFIFSDVVMNVSIWKSFKKYCEIEGNETADYPVFEFCYMRLARGEFNMDYDRSSDPTPRSFSDLPVHIFEKIFENFKFSERLLIRKVSKPLQSLIDSWKPNVRSIQISNDSTGICWEFEEEETEPIVRIKTVVEKTIRFSGRYTDHLETCLYWQPERHRYGFQELRAVLGNPKLRLHSLEINEMKKKHKEQFFNFLNSLNGSQIHVEVFKLLDESNDYPLLPIIQYLNPQVLKKVYLSIAFDEGKYAISETLMSQLANSAYLKNVKLVKFRVYAYDDPPSFDCFIQFPRVSIEVDFDISLAREAVKAIETLVKSTVLEVFYIKNTERFDVDTIMRLLRAQSFLAVDGRPNVFRHKVPNSHQFYEIEVTEEMIRIERMP